MREIGHWVLYSEAAGGAAVVCMRPFSVYPCWTCALSICVCCANALHIEVGSKKHENKQRNNNATKVTQHK